MSSECAWSDLAGLSMAYTVSYTAQVISLLATCLPDLLLAHWAIVSLSNGLLLAAYINIDTTYN